MTGVWTIITALFNGQNDFQKQTYLPHISDKSYHIDFEKKMFYHKRIYALRQTNKYYRIWFATYLVKTYSFVLNNLHMVSKVSVKLKFGFIIKNAVRFC